VGAWVVRFLQQQEFVHFFGMKPLAGSVSNFRRPAVIVEDSIEHADPRTADPKTVDPRKMAAPGVEHSGLSPSQRTPKCTAAPRTQWIYSLVSKASLQKTGVFLNSAGDFWEFSGRKFRSPVSRDH